MADRTPNEEMAAGVGQDKSNKEPIEVYDSKCGKYNPRPSPPAEITGAGQDPSPFKLGNV